jgi:hypothetical protein
MVQPMWKYDIRTCPFCKNRCINSAKKKNGSIRKDD